MFVFPAFNNNFKKRKRTFRCCSHCRNKRIKCVISKDYENIGCNNCDQQNLVCDLVSDVKTERATSSTKAQDATTTITTITTKTTTATDSTTAATTPSNSESSTKTYSPANYRRKQSTSSEPISSLLSAANDTNQTASVPKAPIHAKVKIEDNYSDDEDEGLTFKVKRSRPSSLSAPNSNSPGRSSFMNVALDNKNDDSMSRSSFDQIKQNEPKVPNSASVSASIPKPYSHDDNSNSHNTDFRNNSNNSNHSNNNKNNNVNNDINDDNEAITEEDFVHFRNDEIHFVSTFDSLVKILNLPFTKKNGSTEIKKSNSVTTFQALSSKYIGTTDATAIFIQIAGHNDHRGSELNDRKNSIVGEATGGAIEDDTISESPDSGKDRHGSESNNNIPNYHSAAYKPKYKKQQTAKNVNTKSSNTAATNRNSNNKEEITDNDPCSNSISISSISNTKAGNAISSNPVSLQNKAISNTKNNNATSDESQSKKALSIVNNEHLRDMLGVFVHSTNERNNFFENAKNYGPFKLPVSLFAYLNDCKCFDFGLSKTTQYKLIKLYFKKFNSVLPLLSEESSLTTFKNNHMPTLILYALILLSTRLDGANEILEAEKSIEDINEFNSKLEFKIRTMLKFNLDENRLTLLRTYALLSLYGGGGGAARLITRGVSMSMGTEETTKANVLETSSMDLNIAIHHAFSLGIQHNHYSQSIQNSKRDTSISKAWWCLFILDRLNSLINSRNCIINRKDSSLTFPADKDLNGLVQASIRLEKVLSFYQPHGDNRSVPKDIDFDVWNPTSSLEILESEDKNIGSECMRRLMVNLTIMFAQKRRYDLLDPSSKNYRSEKSVPDEIYCKAALQILNITSQYMKYLPVINFVPYSISFTLSAFLKINLKPIKNEFINGVRFDPALKNWNYQTVLQFLGNLSYKFWYANSTYKLCSEFLKKFEKQLQAVSYRNNQYSATPGASGLVSGNDPNTGKSFNISSGQVGSTTLSQFAGNDGNHNNVRNNGLLADDNTIVRTSASSTRIGGTGHVSQDSRTDPGFAPSSTSNPAVNTPSTTTTTGLTPGPASALPAVPSFLQTSFGDSNNQNTQVPGNNETTGTPATSIPGFSDINMMGRGQSNTPHMGSGMFLPRDASFLRSPAEFTKSNVSLRKLDIDETLFNFANLNNFEFVATSSLNTNLPANELIENGLNAISLFSGIGDVQQHQQYQLIQQQQHHQHQSQSQSQHPQPNATQMHPQSLVPGVQSPIQRHHISQQQQQQQLQHQHQLHHDHHLHQQTMMPHHPQHFPQQPHQLIPSPGMYNLPPTPTGYMSQNTPPIQIPIPAPDAASSNNGPSPNQFPSQSEGQSSSQQQHVPDSSDQLLLLFNELPHVQQFFGTNSFNIDFNLHEPENMNSVSPAVNNGDGNTSNDGGTGTRDMNAKSDAANGEQAVMGQLP